MRSFITASIILVSIISVSIINSVYIVKKTDTLLSMCEQIEKDSSAESVDVLINEWQSCRDMIALAVHKTELERAENAILSLKSYLDAPSDFSYQLSVLKVALEHIADNQKITLDSIL